MKHTEGEWGIKISDDNETFWMGEVIGTNHDGQPQIGKVVWVVSWKRRMRGFKEECLTDARRIVAEHNACLGISKAALEKGIVEKSIEMLLRAHNQFNLPSETTRDNATWMGVKVWEEDTGTPA